MKIALTASLLAAFAASSLSAQQVALTEHFNAGVPPAGWSQVKNNPLTQGWIASAAGEAWHEDESSSIGTCDDELISPVLDLSTYTTVYAHMKTRLAFSNYLANHPNSLGDGESDLYVRINGGAWVEVWTDTRTASTTDVITVDMTAATAGQANVEFALRYYGTFAQEWWVDWIQVSDSASPPIFGSFLALNLPTAFVAADGSCDDFESYAGVVPSHMATTARNTATGLPDPEAWCTIAGGTVASNSGVRNLEMGMIPGTTNYHNVTNALVIGYNGAGTSSLMADFYAIDHGEEINTIDGVWISEDGAEWFQAYGPWSPLPASWTAVSVDLSAFSSLTGGDFYLAFVQEDNFPYANLDGIGIDDVCVGDPAPPAFTLAATGTCPGAITLDTTNGTANANVAILHGAAGSFTQNNPNKPCQGVTLDIAAPTVGAIVAANGSGAATLNYNVPVAACGRTVQAVDLGSCSVSNAIVL